MEQTIAFVLGVLAVLVIAGVYNMFKTRGQVKDLYEEVKDLHDIINEIERQLNLESDLLDRRIDGEIDRLNITTEELYKYVDSRTDKMESRCDSRFEEIEVNLKK
jgi:hypothetical protein|tara:strand:- start:254 stop:568 length:315 start_codon:yes stop_codon:yes gene_type:complete